MDISLAPKLLAAALIGGTVATTLPRSGSESSNSIVKLEWIETGKGKKADSLVLRIGNDETTVVRQGARTVEVTPHRTTGGGYLIELKVEKAGKTEAESLTTRVESGNGETVVVMGNTTKDGRRNTERLLFLTANPIEKD